MASMPPAGPPVEPPSDPPPPSPTPLPWPYGPQAEASRSDALPAYAPQSLPPLPYSGTSQLRERFQRNPILAVAQIAAVVQGCLAVLSGIRLFRFEVGINRIVSALALPGANGFPTVSVGLIVIGVLVIIVAALIGRPSPVARWLLTLWEVVIFLFTLALVAFGQGIVPLTVDAVLVGGGAVVDPIVVLALQGFIIYGLAVHAATYRAFAR